MRLKREASPSAIDSEQTIDRAMMRATVAGLPLAAGREAARWVRQNRAVGQIWMMKSRSDSCFAF